MVLHRHPDRVRAADVIADSAVRHHSIWHHRSGDPNLHIPTEQRLIGPLRSLCPAVSMRSAPVGPLLTRVAPRPPVAFVDESYDYTKDGSRPPLYVLAAVIIDGDRLAEVRTATQTVISPETDYHTTDLHRDGRLEVVHAMLENTRNEAGWSVVAVQMPFDGDSNAARRHCFEVLLPDLSSRRVRYVVPDSRPQPGAADPAVLDKQDELIARRLRSNQRVDRHLSLTHRRPADENLLWLADAVAWAVRR